MTFYLMTLSTRFHLAPTLYTFRDKTVKYSGITKRFKSTAE